MERLDALCLDLRDLCVEVLSPQSGSIDSYARVAGVATFVEFDVVDDGLNRVALEAGGKSRAVAKLAGIANWAITVGQVHAAFLVGHAILGALFVHPSADPRTEASTDRLGFIGRGCHLRSCHGFLCAFVPLWFNYSVFSACSVYSVGKFPSS